MTFREAIESENLELVKELLAEEPAIIEMPGSDGTPLCFVAAATGNLDLVKYIVEYSRASMNVTDRHHQNILHYGARSGNVELVAYLVEKVGMNPLSGDCDLKTPFDIAREMGYKDLESYFENLCGASLGEMYRNPIRTGMFPDPSIVRVGEDYYMVNSTFIFFPCIPVSHSKDLIHWRIIGYAITDPKWADLEELEGGRGYWAPDISYYEGRFYITATYRMNDTGTVYRKQIVVSSERPEGPYSKPAIIDEDGIDPSIFNDDDGKRYMLLNRGARIFELDQTATRQLSEAKLLYYGSQKRAPEGPHLLKKDGYYYLFLAEGGTGPGHRITVARSRELFGNYEPCPYNPIMRQFDGEGAIQRCGHGKPVMTQNGDWYMVYLCGRMIGEGYSILGRETAIDPITWTQDGWPLVNNLQGPSALQIKPDLPECSWESTDEDGFDKGILGLDWMFSRPPEADGYTIKDSKIWLKGSAKPLSSREARNILLRRQKDFVFEALVTMDVISMSDGQSAGMTCYYDENTWLTFGLTGDGSGGHSLRIREHIGTKDKEVLPPVQIDEGHNTIWLKVSTDHLRRSFFYSLNGKDYKSFGTLQNVYYLCDEGIRMGKRFTGAMIGIYAYGADKAMTVPFDYFGYFPK